MKNKIFENLRIDEDFSSRVHRIKLIIIVMEDISEEIIQVYKKMEISPLCSPLWGPDLCCNIPVHPFMLVLTVGVCPYNLCTSDAYGKNIYQ